MSADKRILRVISLGAGVQSTTVALMAAHGEVGPMPDCAIFADTQAEPAKIYSSRYGGNDPDVWPTGKCEACDGSGTAKCEARGCSSDATVFNEDGEALCQDCFEEWVTAAYGPSTHDVLTATNGD